ncbi:hypothetical protein GW820_07105 [archaeon]|nr:hypothetical protein [archaeon]
MSGYKTEINESPSKDRDSEEFNDMINNLPESNTLYSKSKNKKFATAKILKTIAFPNHHINLSKNVSNMDKADNILNSFHRKSTILEILEMKNKSVSELVHISDETLSMLKK